MYVITPNEPISTTSVDNTSSDYNANLGYLLILPLIAFISLAITFYCSYFKHMIAAELDSRKRSKPQQATELEEIASTSHGQGRSQDI